MSLLTSFFLRPHVVPCFFFASARGSLVSAVEDEEAPKSIWDQSGFMLARLLHWLTVEPGF